MVKIKKEATQPQDSDTYNSIQTTLIKTKFHTPILQLHSYKELFFIVTTSLLFAEL